MELLELIQTLNAAHGPSGDEGGIRERLAAVAGSVKRRMIRWVRVAVFPLPAAADKIRLPPEKSMAACCDAVQVRCAIIAPPLLFTPYACTPPAWDNCRREADCPAALVGNKPARF